MLDDRESYGDRVFRPYATFFIAALALAGATAVTAVIAARSATRKRQLLQAQQQANQWATQALVEQEARYRLLADYTKAPGQGMGPGMTIVHGIVRQTGGEIRVSSSLGAGTTIICHKWRQ